MSAPTGVSDGLHGLLIDYGGVLTNAIGPVMTAFCRSVGLPEDALAAVARPESAFRPKLDAYERGEYEDAEFLPMFAAALGLAARDLDAFLSDLRPDDRMFGAVAALRDHGVRVGLLSNSWGMSDYPLALLDDAFDGVVISGQVGMRKPEPSIYRHAAELIGVEPSDCVFVDDTEGNVAVAAGLGMTVIHHEYAQQTLRELQLVFEVDLGVSA
jgi:epoxide hydrolase-like predicted phosphatase